MLVAIRIIRKPGKSAKVFKKVAVHWNERIPERSLRVYQQLTSNGFDPLRDCPAYRMRGIAKHYNLRHFKTRW